MKGARQVVGIDFDDTLYDRSTAVANGDTTGDPTEGAMDALFSLLLRYDVLIISGRCNSGKESQHEMREWIIRKSENPDLMESYFMKGRIKIADNKPFVYLIDDNCFRFQGNWDEILKSL